MQKPTSKQRKQLVLYKKTLVLSQSQFEIALGLLLGDVSIQTQNKGKTYRLKFQQSDKLHRDYIFHLYNIFNEWVLSPPFLDKKRNMWSFQTISHQEFNKLAELFILDENKTKCKKYVKSFLIENYFTPLSLAYWFMDDGGKSCYTKKYPRKGFSLNTQSFTERNVELLCDALHKKFGLYCWKKPNKKGFIIVISARSYDLMMSLIGDLVIPSMRYKLPRN
jgi:hypothetical protein